MNLPLKIASRYFFSRRGSGGLNAISIISGISLAGYITGAAALIIVLSVFNGFEDLFSKMYGNFDPDVKISAVKGKSFDTANINISAIRQTDGVLNISLTLEENVLLRYDNKQSLSTVKGVDNAYLSVSHLDSCVVRGTLLLQKGDTNFALVGQGIAYQLGVDPDNQFNFLAVYAPRKGKIDMLNPEGAFNKNIISPAGTFAVQDEVDNKYVIVPLSFLRTLLEKEKQVSSLEIIIKPGADINEVKGKIQTICGDSYKVQNRYEQREAFYKVVRSEKAISYIILLFILIIAAFNTIGSLYMLVMEKKKDLRLFSGMGMEAKNIANVFRYESLLIAFTGGILGILLGFVVCYLQEEYGFVKLNYNVNAWIQAYPVMVKFSDFILVFITILSLGFFTSLYPAYKAKKLI